MIGMFFSFLAWTNIKNSPPFLSNFPCKLFEDEAIHFDEVPGIGSVAREEVHLQFYEASDRDKTPPISSGTPNIFVLLKSLISNKRGKWWWRSFFKSNHIFWNFPVRIEVISWCTVFLIVHHTAINDTCNAWDWCKHRDSVSFCFHIDKTWKVFARCRYSMILPNPHHHPSQNPCSLGEIRDKVQSLNKHNTNIVCHCWLGSLAWLSLEGTSLFSIAQFMCRTGQSRITPFGAGCGEKIERWTIAQKAERQVKFLRWRKLKPLNRFTKSDVFDFPMTGIEKELLVVQPPKFWRQESTEAKCLQFQVHLELDTCDMFTCFRDWIRPYRKATRKFLLIRVWEFWKWIPTVKLISLRGFFDVRSMQDSKIMSFLTWPIYWWFGVVSCFSSFGDMTIRHSSLHPDDIYLGATYHRATFTSKQVIIHCYFSRRPGIGIYGLVFPPSDLN